MFDEALRKLRDIQQRAEQMDGRHSVSFNDLFHDEFMLRNTDFESIDALFQASGFKVETKADFESIPDDEWDAFVKEHTRFDSWEDMKGAAVKEWVARGLGFDE